MGDEGRISGGKGFQVSMNVSNIVWRHKAFTSSKPGLSYAAQSPSLHRFLVEKVEQHISYRVVSMAWALESNVGLPERQFVCVGNAA